MLSEAPIQRDRRPLATALVVVLFVATLVLLQAAGPARGQSKSEELAQVRDRQVDLAEQIQSHNGEVNALIGEVSALREREAAANAELAEREAELERTTAELAANRDRLAELREQLADASKELEGMLVSMYKAGQTELVVSVLESESFGEVAARTEYMNRIGDYQSAVIERARTLREETEGIVTELAADRERIAEARDAIAAHRDELAASRADLEAQEAQLAAAREQRRGALASLEDREGQLVRALSTPDPEPVATDTGTTTSPEPAPAPAPAPGSSATIGSDGKAIPPAGAPPAVVAAIAAANQIEDMPYVWGGGHGSFEASGYDCSGAVSYALHGGGLLDAPLDSTGLMFWGEPGPGQWITVYANSGHTYAVIAGLRWDTSGTSGSGPSWSTSLDGYLDSSAYTVRHPAGL